MDGADTPAAIRVSAAAFGLDLAEPDTERTWSRRVRHSVELDPEGAFVAVVDGRVTGVASALRREGVWILSLLATDPAAQSGGLGRGLLDAALGYARPGDAGLIVSSDDPRALRLYGRAGFALRPAFQARGRVDRSQVPGDLPPVRDASGELDALAAISRAIRGASHALELPHAIERGARVLALDDRGFVVAAPGYGVWLLAALDVPAATALLWHALAIADETERAVIRWITAEQQWAIEVALRAGLELETHGAVCDRDLAAPLAPYLPSGPFA